MGGRQQLCGYQFCDRRADGPDHYDGRAGQSGEGRSGSGGTEYESDVRASGERRTGSGADVPVVRMI